MRPLVFLLLLILLSSSFGTPLVYAAENIPSPERLLSDENMTNTQAMTLEEVQAFLARGYLGTYRTQDAFGVTRSAAEIIMQTAQAFQMNPQVILVTLQKEQSLVESSRPSQKQLDWAMGYAICDDCSMQDPQLQKYKGFGKQVYQATKRFRDAYLTNLETKGVTSSGHGPGIQSIIDGTALLIENNATAALYTYTPHLHGNINFMQIWNRWFVNKFPTGTLLQDKSSGSVWLIQDGQKRPIISRAALASRFNTSAIIPVRASLLEDYPEGKPIQFPNYSLLRTPNGSVYLIVDDTRRGFVSMQAFQDTGFKQDEIVDATYEDISAFTEGDLIFPSSSALQTTLWQDVQTGGIFAINGDEKHPIFSREILRTQFPSAAIHPAKTEKLHALKTSSPVLFPDGTLVGAVGSPDVFVIEEGKRRLIEDAATFLTYGWKWHQIYWTTERAALLHPLGEPVSTKLQNESTD